METEVLTQVSAHVDDLKFYGIIFAISAVGHLAHWIKKSAIDKDKKSFKNHFVDQFPSTVAALMSGFGALFMTLDPILIGAIWKPSLITAFTMGFASDSTVNGKFGK